MAISAACVLSVWKRKTLVHCWSVPGPSDLEPDAAADGGDAGGEIPTGEVADDDAGGPEADEDPIAA